ncbi:hypothetical protein [Aeromonas diversa]|uniref:hypothetical protein n=1 Tax=Aeromonas diversa TaxID=502790 RepID=UPI0012E04DD2|nr:hypothetical protein [Aeromonas diversa]
MSFDLPTVLSVWGALLSTTLAFLRVKEYWSGRFKIELNYVFRSDPVSGNEISVQNLSGKPVLLNYMDLFYHKKGWWPLIKEDKELWSPEDELINQKIDPHSEKTFCFARGDHFCHKDKVIYARLYFAGRKVMVQRVGE